MAGFTGLPDDEQEEFAVGLGVVGMGERHRLGALGGNVEPAGGDLGCGIGGQGAEADEARSPEGATGIRPGKAAPLVWQRRLDGSSLVVCEFVAQESGSLLQA
jgi:hypothetical protein